jgi:hypothetical protein
VSWRTGILVGREVCSGAKSTSYSIGHRTFSLEVRRSVHRADHTPPSSTEVDNAWSYISNPLRSYKYVSSDVTVNTRFMPVHILCTANYYTLSVLFIMF